MPNDLNQKGVLDGVLEELFGHQSRDGCFTLSSDGKGCHELCRQKNGMSGIPEASTLKKNVEA